LYGDVGPIESLNSLLKLQTNRSPNIILELIDARVKLKKWLGASATRLSRQDDAGSGKTFVKTLSHDALMERAAEVVREAEQYIDQADDIVQNLERSCRPATSSRLACQQRPGSALKLIQDAADSRGGRYGFWLAAGLSEVVRTQAGR
jgi:hypothetical protein